MQKLTFVIGANAAGKTYFIEHHLANEKAVVLDVYDYQQKVYDEHGNKERITFEEQFRCLKKANEKHLHDIINELKQGNDVIAEQTFFKAKRRIAYIDEIRNEMDVKIEVYVMHVVSVSATTRKPRKGEVDGKSYYFKKREEFEDLINKNEFLEFAEYAGEYYGTLKKDVYKNYFKGKNVIIEIDSQGARQIREKQKIQSVFLIPPSFEELLHRLKNRGTESKESIHRRLKQALDEIEHIEEYGVLLVNDSVEGTAFVIDALFHLGLKNASGMNERELKIAREIREGIIKYLSDEEDE